MTSAMARDEMREPSPSDPLGYYECLEVGPLADAALIRAAYRRLKALPDDDSLSPEENDEKRQALETAFRVLSDPRQRAAYDATLRLPKPPFQDPDPDEYGPDPLACSVCGKVSTQPRYIRFHHVSSRLFKTRRHSIEGIFCKDCADHIAIRASTASWRSGWWGPRGPTQTVAALIHNLKGGERPRDANLALLLRQTRAFRAEGRYELLSAMADQTGRFAASDDERMAIDSLTQDAIRPGRPLKDRWRRGGYAAVIQTLPLIALTLALLAATVLFALRDRTDSAAAEIIVPPARPGDMRHVAVDMLKVRQAPSEDQPVVALLDRFMLVRVMAADQDGKWARIMTPGGVVGYVPQRLLFGGTGAQSRDLWCKSQMGEPPVNGDVLMRRTGGEHELKIVNATGHDIVMRLKTPAGPTLMAFFVARGKSARIDGVPKGRFDAVFATGQHFSRACGLFLEEMQTYRPPQTGPIQIPARNGTLVIPPIGPEPDHSQEIALDAYLDRE